MRDETEIVKVSMIPESPSTTASFEAIYSVSA
jgi:hypothetical protein